jgi:hypothetical protein
MGNIRHLHVGRYDHAHSLLGVTPWLESFLLIDPIKKLIQKKLIQKDLNEIDLTTLVIPWATLRDFQLFEVEGWHPIMDNFTVNSVRLSELHASHPQSL